MATSRGLRVSANGRRRGSDPRCGIRARASRSVAERAFELAWRIAPSLAHVELASEFWFHPVRKWRFDFAFPAYRVAVEIDGRGRGNSATGELGRHQTIDGVRRDLEKQRAAVLRGWRVLRFPATDKDQAAAWVREVRELLAMCDPELEQCVVCDCTDSDCSGCVARTGEPCYWVALGVCSACADRMRPKGARRRAQRSGARAAPSVAAPTKRP